MDNYNITTEKVESETPLLKWNWGAFMMSPYFGVGTKAYLCLLTLVPLLNFVWIFVSGACGARWAYESGEYGSVKEFNAVMKSWNRVGVVLAIIALIGIVLYFVLIIATAGMLVNGLNLIV